jgi:cysteinyl-tRNA synthetase
MKAFVEDIFGLKSELQGDYNKLEGVLQVLIDLRKQARAKKDFATSDTIRNQLLQLGIALKDEKDGNMSYSFN